MFTSVVPVPDGTATREFLSFNSFCNITDSGRMFTVSEICLRFPKYVNGFRNMDTVSEICGRSPILYVTYPRQPRGTLGMSDKYPLLES
jgi:hypothetical protein